MFESYATEDFGAFFVITEDEIGADADAAYCRSRRTQFGLTMPVLLDPRGRLRMVAAVPTNDADVVLEHGMRIVLERQYAPESAVAAAIDGVLGL